jgi:hypothetical protein
LNHRIHGTDVNVRSGQNIHMLFARPNPGLHRALSGFEQQRYNGFEILVCKIMQGRLSRIDTPQDLQYLGSSKHGVINLWDR